MPNKWLEGLAQSTFDLNQINIKSLVGNPPHVRLCDLGCDDGRWTVEVGRAAGATRLHGVEILPDRAQLARENGINAIVADLNRRLPYADESFDLVHANQVIEHVTDLDMFMSEIFRILTWGGMSVIATENGSSWHNIAAAILGWQIFSLSNVSSKVGGLGNPLALHRGEPGMIASWTHKTILNYRGLVEIHAIHGLQPMRVRGAGYHPLPPRVGWLDVRHAHLLAVLAVKQRHQPDRV